MLGCNSIELDLFFPNTEESLARNHQRRPTYNWIGVLKSIVIWMNWPYQLPDMHMFNHVVVWVEFKGLTQES